MELDLQTTEQNQPCKDYGLPYEQFNYTALGGTFDNIHAGHKILLSTALALTKKSITIGITMTSMNKSKLPFGIYHFTLFYIFVGGIAHSILYVSSVCNFVVNYKLVLVFGSYDFTWAPLQPKSKFWRNMQFIVEKTLCELIRPYEERRADVHSYLSDVNPYVDYNIVPLEDPFGPTITERHLQCLIVSEETAKGGHAVNQKRKENVTF